MNEPDASRLVESYDSIAKEYADHIADELKDKPLDREMLDETAKAFSPPRKICDMGCGPGHVARYLSDRGADVIGVDISEGMLQQARQLNPGIEFRQGDMLALDVPDASWDCIVAFYSIIHIPRDRMGDALRELRRTLRPGGLLLLAFHIGDGALHRDELWGKEVSLDFLLFQTDEIVERLRETGFEIHRIVEREPYPDVEYPSRRAYLFARPLEIS